jgi:hypothetical protein
MMGRERSGDAARSKGLSWRRGYQAEGAALEALRLGRSQANGLGRDLLLALTSRGLGLHLGLEGGKDAHEAVSDTKVGKEGQTKQCQKNQCAPQC